jgi:hypothetical protein
MATDAERAEILGRLMESFAQGEAALQRTARLVQQVRQAGMTIPAIAEATGFSQPWIKTLTREGHWPMRVGKKLGPRQPR